MKHLLKMSDSRILDSTKPSQALSKASFKSSHICSSSSGTSSIVRTSGHLASIDTFTSLSMPKSSDIFLKLSIYSCARDLLYLRNTFASV